jgi:hypothetical protein
LGVVAIFLIVITGVRAAGPPLTADEFAQAVRIGQRCEAPIMRLSASGANFDAYVESPFARVALVAATARVMHQSLESPGVKQAMRPGYRVWFVPKRNGLLPTAVTRVGVRFAAGEIAPVGQMDERLFLGTVASHGIIEPLRARFPEFLFERWPPDDFVVVVNTERGTKRFTATARQRSSLMRVCN